MALTLDITQTETLRELLDNALRDLRFEIADTDNSAFKAGLRDRQRVLRSILDLLPAEAPGPAVTGGSR